MVVPRDDPATAEGEQRIAHSQQASSTQCNHTGLLSRCRRQVPCSTDRKQNGQKVGDQVDGAGDDEQRSPIDVVAMVDGIPEPPDRAALEDDGEENGDVEC